MSTMKQPRKDVLREQLALAASEIERWKGEVDRIAAQLEGEAKCFAAGFLCCALLAVVVWWIQ